MKTILFTRAYNAEKTIGRTIESILNQTCGDFDYYVLNNGCTDSTGDIVADYAKLDKRVVPLRLKKHDVTNDDAIVSALIHASDADYFAICDADDEYTHDFLENMTAFARENRLDIASCGYEKVDGITGDVTKHRALTENLIIEGAQFADAFIQYRGFTVFLWAKLYSIPFMRSRGYRFYKKEDLAGLCADSITSLDIFSYAKRIGVYGKSMYKYYQYPNSLLRKYIKSTTESAMESYREYYTATKEYLAAYGPISKLNEDYLYSIYLSFVDEYVNNIFSADGITTEARLRLLASAFHNDLWAATLAHNADVQFRNLAARREYVESVRRKILDLPEIEQHDELRDDLFRYLFAVI